MSSFLKSFSFRQSYVVPLQSFFIFSLFLHLMVRNHVQATAAENSEGQLAKDNKNLEFEIDSSKSFSEAMEALTKTRDLKVENLKISFNKFEELFDFEDFWKELLSQTISKKSYATAVSNVTNVPFKRHSTLQEKAPVASVGNVPLSSFELYVGSDLQDNFNEFEETVPTLDVLLILRRICGHFSTDIVPKYLEMQWQAGTLKVDTNYESYAEYFESYFQPNVEELKSILSDKLNSEQLIRQVFQSMAMIIFYQKIIEIFIEPFAKNSENVTLHYDLSIPILVKPVAFSYISNNLKSLQLRGSPFDSLDASLLSSICKIPNLFKVALDNSKLTEQFLSFVSKNEMERAIVGNKIFKLNKYNKWTHLKLRLDDYNDFEASKLETLKSLSSLENLTVIGLPVNYSACLDVLKRIAILNNALTIEIVDFTKFISFPGLRLCPIIGSKLEITASDLDFVFSDGRKVSETELNSMQSDEQKLTEFKRSLS